MTSLQYQTFLDSKISPTPTNITPVPYIPGKPMAPGTVVDRTPANMSIAPSPSAPSEAAGWRSWFGGGEKKERSKPLILPNGIIVCDSKMVKKIPDVMYVPASEITINALGREVAAPLPYTFTGYMSGNCITITIKQNDGSRPEETYVVPTSGIQLTTE